MKIIPVTLILLSAIFSAQEKKADTTKRSYFFKSEKLPQEIVKNPTILKSDSVVQPNNVYKMPFAKPKDTSVYLSLKEVDKDYSKYKILNSIAPEPSKKEIKK
jgi:hypothetical protein